MKKKTSPQDPALTKMKYNVHAKSPYNDGWTQEAYRKEIKEMERKDRIEGIKLTILAIAFPILLWILLYLSTK